MKNSTAAKKPLILPCEIIQMLRGERGYTESSKDIVELAINRYRAGRAGRTYDPPSAPGSAPQIVETLERFLRVCWEQGRKDAEEVSA